MKVSALVVSLSFLALATSACGGGNLASTMLDTPDNELEERCDPKSAKPAADPLVIEWSASERVALEAQIRKGLVAVRYAGCEIEVLRRCKVGGEYGYAGTTRQSEKLTIKNEDELFLQVPMGALKLAAALKSSGQLNVDMTIVGRYESEATTFERSTLSGTCEGATHVITGINPGAFVLTTGASAEVGGGVNVAEVAGAGAKSSAKRETLNSAGDAAACETSTGDDERPPDNCGAMLRIEVAPITGK